MALLRSGNTSEHPLGARGCLFFPPSFQLPPNSARVTSPHVCPWGKQSQRGEQAPKPLHSALRLQEAASWGACAPGGGNRPALASPAQACWEPQGRTPCSLGSSGKRKTHVGDSKLGGPGNLKACPGLRSPAGSSRPLEAADVNPPGGGAAILGLAEPHTYILRASMSLHQNSLGTQRRQRVQEARETDPHTPQDGVGEPLCPLCLRNL